LREFSFPDGRKLLVDRRALAFITPVKDDNRLTLIGFRTLAKPCPVNCSYDDVKAWWFGEMARVDVDAV